MPRQSPGGAGPKASARGKALRLAEENIKDPTKLAEALAWLSNSRRTAKDIYQFSIRLEPDLRES